MGESLQWQAFYEALPDGRSKITDAALIALKLKEGWRVLESMLGGGPKQVLLLDKPLQVAERVRDSEIPEYYLLRIRIGDLPGWPPIFALTGAEIQFPSLMDCRFKSARYFKGKSTAQEGLELELEHHGIVYKAWHTGCHGALLHCLEATLNQEGLSGRKLRDLQQLRLIAAVNGGR